MGMWSRFMDVQRQAVAEANERQAAARRKVGVVGIALDDDGNITRNGDVRPVAGVTATVDTSGNINRRITLTRLVGGGVVGGLVFKKKQDDRELYLLVDGPDFQWVAPLNPAAVSVAREFAAEVNTAGRVGRANV